MGSFRKRDLLKRKSLFTQGNESGTAIIITFFLSCSECENIIFHVVCWTSDHLLKIKKMEQAYEKTQENRIYKKEVS